MSIRLAELVERCGGELIGSPDTQVTGIAPLTEAGVSHISFLSNSKLRAQAGQSRAAALIVSPNDDALVAQTYTGARIVTKNPYAYFARAAQYFEALTAIVPAPGVHPSASVDPAAQVDATAHIGPLVTIEAGAVIGAHVVIDAGCYVGRDAVIGASTHLFANVTFHARCVIGARGILHSGAVIGTDGFGFANEGGVYIKIPQTGRVVIGDDVDIGANTTVDRGALADTVIEDGVKLDNQIQIGHNCHIGAHTAMAGCVGVAGSAKIGKYCTFGGAAMVLGHLTIADHVHVSSGSMVSRSILEPGQYTGFYPLAKNSEWEKSAAIVRNLSTMREKIRSLEKAIKTITNQASGHKDES
ncbi:UDP-3-O-[3-hydroxymyristoyl] glucosamine N-acyltransferase [Pseudoduganella lurida]|uniref:UDP-3-O-acylglucosamine N-acyltransferase n=1 Tax=Pseudoduganella lurida TaxID=1036180 RepID=A0A562REJ0_9BURK|nr:UDP-3-O-(3-hydroxymyristoyl)glucosamine N-acyltransferase [Pseudoduganella lurida]TWI67497.1 UDP-3-O-[3-hydroxymyristoyl] glucosamine N-acyltransferase [Pseudoduganella lurida]